MFGCYMWPFLKETMHENSNSYRPALKDTNMDPNEQVQGLLTCAVFIASLKGTSSFSLFLLLFPFHKVNINGIL